MGVLSPGVLLPSLLLASLVHAADPQPSGSTAAFFANPVLSSPRISPDGKHIAALYSDGDAQVIVVRAVDGGKFEAIASLPTEETRFRWLDWANADRILISLQGRNRNPSSHKVRSRATRMVGIDRDGDNFTLIGEKWKDKFAGDRGTHTAVRDEVQIQDAIVSWLPNDPEHVLIEYQDPTMEFPDVRKLDVRSGKLGHAQRHMQRVSSWAADHDGHVRVGIGYRDTDYALFARRGRKGRFRELDFGAQGLRFVDFSYEPHILYVRKSHQGRDAIYEYDIEKKQLGKQIFSRSDVDAGSLVFDRARELLVGVEYVVDEPRRQFIDEVAEREQAKLDRALPDTWNTIVSETPDRTRAIVLATSDRQPPAFYIYDRATKRLGSLFASYPGVDPASLAPIRAVSYAARDGVTIPAYLTVPPGLEPKNLPVIVFPHGGPRERDYRRYDAVVQFLASRGFAVFQMNFRGSAGYGDAFEERGYREWGLATQRDIEDGTRWLIAEGIADADRIGIYGASYGGYAALMGLVSTPELYRAGASYAGVTSLPMLLSDDKAYLLASPFNRDRIGDDRTRLKATSPLENVDAIRAPVFLAHGQDDAQVHIRHSSKMASALSRADKPVEYMEFENEVHGFLLEQNRIAFYDKLASFFEQHLADRHVSAGAEP